jgi:hypothetical protein
MFLHIVFFYFLLFNSTMRENSNPGLQYFLYAEVHPPFPNSNSPYVNFSI